MSLQIASRRIALCGIALAGLVGSVALGDGSARAGETEASTASPSVVLHCGAAQALASGKPDPQLFSAAASRGVRAIWCERYDSFGRAVRVGPYRELYPDGRVRTEASYQQGRLHGPLVVRHEDGRPWLRSVYAHGVEIGPLEIFHPSGGLWLEGELQDGVLHGVVRTYLPEGSLESEIDFGPGGNDSAPPSDLHPATPASLGPIQPPASRGPAPSREPVRPRPRPDDD